MEQPRDMTGAPIRSVSLPAGANRHSLDSLSTRNEPGVLAIITDTDGPSYRPVGAAMALFPSSEIIIGSLSSGCVESDLLHHAKASLDARQPKTVRYGIGSPYMDIQLPCGGALEVTLVPQPNPSVLSNITATLDRREPAHLYIDSVASGLSASPSDEALQITYEPDIHFTVVGKGPEAEVFTRLAIAAGFPAQLWSPEAVGDHRLQKGVFPQNAIADQWSAIILFFHDHDWEPDLLQAALATDAHYIGAQGSQRARASRDATLSAMGVPDDNIARIRGPIGLIPSARDPQTLAVSVLADVLAAFKR